MPKLNENTELAMPIRNLIALIAAATLGTWAYFGVIERLNTLENQYLLMSSDLEQNTAYRINSLPENSEQFMLIEHLSAELEKLSTQIESGQAPFDQTQRLELDFVGKRLSKIEESIEKMRNP